MNRQFLLTIGLILVAIVGFGCVSATDNTTAGIDDASQMTVDQNIHDKDVSEVNDVVSKINENKKIEEINSTQSSNFTKDDINVVNESSQNVSGYENSTYGLKTEQQETEKLMTAIDFDSGNDFTPEKIVEINKYVEVYKNNNYQLKSLLLEIVPKYILNKNLDMDGLMHVLSFVAAIHNKAIADRGYGEYYTAPDIYLQVVVSAILSL